jgi:N-succinyldiaminopimelate aminotransferase
VVATRLKAFGTSIFGEMTQLAIQHGAINLSQGFPDFDGPAEIIDAAYRAMRAGHNQYARTRGVVELVEAIAASRERSFGLRYDPLSEVVVFSGATEGIASTLLGLLNPGDEVILIEPYYDSYPVCVTLAGAVPRFLTLRFPDFALDPDELRRLVTSRTRLIVLNSPHNPTGKVMTRAELDAIARVACDHDLIVLADEVYEHLTYDDAVHVPIATLPGMRERTLSLSSTGKTFSMTGWKIGWATGPARLIDAAQAAHQFVTFATATPLQVAMAEAVRRFLMTDAYLSELRRQYLERRDFLTKGLEEVGFRVAVPRGTYFILADFSRLSSEDDQTFARRLVRDHGVATVPPSVFYSAHPEEGRRLLRFAFCKRQETLAAAAMRLRGLRPAR